MIDEQQKSDDRVVESRKGEGVKKEEARGR
jgi:hypothetical protein